MTRPRSIALGLVLALLVAACAPVSESTTTVSDEVTTTQAGATTTSAASETTQQDAQGQVFTMGTIGELTHLRVETPVVGTVTWYDAVFDSLVSAPTGETEFQPDLAESWEVSDDGLTYTFHLREGVVFHNGKPFDSAAALAAIEWARDPERNVQAGPRMGTDITFEAPDANTVVFHLGTPNPGILWTITDLRFQDVTDPEAGIGTGPFKVDNLQPGVELALVRNDEFWGSPAPLDEYHVKQFADAAAATIALENGEIDGFTQPPLSEVARLAENSAFVVFETDVREIHSISLNTATPPLDDVRVRQALSLAMPREEFTEVNFGFSVPTVNFFAPTSVFYPGAEADQVVYDLDAARALLEEAGVADGFDLVFEISQSVNPEILDWLPVYQASLAEIGVNLEISVLETATWSERFQGGLFEGMSSAKYSSGGLADPAATFRGNFIKPDGNSSHFESQEYTDMVAAAAIELDPARRIELYHELAAFMQEQAFLYSVGAMPLRTILADYVSGFNMSHSGRLNADNISVDK